MNKTSILTLLVGLLAGGAIVALTFGGGDDGAPSSAPEKAREVLYWKGPMNPNYHSDKPGKSPMGMDLVPVYADEGGGDGKSLRIDPVVINNIGVRTGLVRRGTIAREIETVGFVTPDEDLTSHVHVRTAGWIEKLLFKAEGDRVKKGDLLFRMYSPTLVNAQAEYLQALRLTQSGLAGAAAERLSVLGMTKRQVAALKKRGTADQLVDIHAPQDGIIIKLNVAEGTYVAPAKTILSLADLSSVWVMAEVYEDQAGAVAVGQKVDMRLAYAPGRQWQGSVAYVYPTVDPVSRTVRLRLVFDNSDEELKLNMYARMTLYGSAIDGALSIPREALIRSGRDDRVILALDGGRFRPARVVAGIESGGRIQILSGLNEGERIVTSGQFLIDSEASLDASMLRLTPVKAPDKAPPMKDTEMKDMDMSKESKQ